MPIDFYQHAASSPCRAVQLAGKLIGVALNIKNIDLSQRENCTPEFSKLNPQHQVPVINDDGFILNESRAIITYLFNKYGKDDSLYPKDPQKRALVDKMLYFDMGTLYQRFADYVFPSMFEGKDFDPNKLEKLGEAVGLFDKMLHASEFAAGNKVTLADASLAATVTTIDAVDIIDLKKYEKVSRWYEKCKGVIPGFEENSKGAVEFAEYFKMMTGK